MRPNRTDTVFIAGYGQVPANTPSYQLYKVVVVSVEVTPDGEIVDAYCTLATPNARRMIVSVMRGKRIPEDVPAILKEIERRYIAYSQKAILFAFKDVVKKYLAWRDEEIGEEPEQ